jgi:hypothetical protein
MPPQQGQHQTRVVVDRRALLSGQLSFMLSFMLSMTAKPDALSEPPEVMDGD